MKKKINLHIFEVFETGKKTMLLKGKPIVSTSASRDWFPRYVVHKNKNLRIKAEPTIISANLLQNKFNIFMNYMYCLTNDFLDLYEMKTLFLSLEYFGANYSKTLLQQKKQKIYHV